MFGGAGREERLSRDSTMPKQQRGSIQTCRYVIYVTSRKFVAECCPDRYIKLLPSAVATRESPEHGGVKPKAYRQRPRQRTPFLDAPRKQIADQLRRKQKPLLSLLA